MKALFLLLFPVLLHAQVVRPTPPRDNRPPARMAPPGMVCRVPQRPTRLEMAPLRPPLTERQRQELMELRNKYRQEVRRVLDRP
jgi:hypothetical protein